MTKNSVSNYASVIKEQAVLQETLVGYNAKAQAMLELILEINLADCLPSRVRFLHDALCAICDLVIMNRGLSETILDRLLKAVAEADRKDEAVDRSDNEGAFKTDPLAGDPL